LTRLLLITAGLLVVIHLGNWIKLGGATLIGGTNVGENTFSTVSLGAPGNLSALAAGGAVNLSWSAGANGTGYALGYAANGNSSDCSAAVFDGPTTVAATAFIDPLHNSPPGSWGCYRAATAAGGWTSPEPNPITAVQLGFVAGSVSFVNAGDTNACGAEQTGAASQLDCGDQISIGFNQPVIAGTGPGGTDSVCADTAGDALWLGSATTTGACSSSEVVSVGALNGSSVDGCDCRFAATYAWDAGGQTLVITVGVRTDGAGYPDLGGGPWTFQPTTDSARLHSAAGEFHVCDYSSGDSNCWPATQ
jgi:hypothetical protein